MNYKNKNKYLVIGFVLFIVLCYPFTIGKTFEIKNQLKALKNEDLITKNIPKQLARLKHKNKYFDSQLEKYKYNGSSIQNNLLEILHDFSNVNHIKIVDFLEPHIINNGDLSTKTYQFTLEGDFSSILLFLYKIEKQTKFGEITSVKYLKNKNYRTGKNYLNAKIYLKSYI